MKVLVIFELIPEATNVYLLNVKGEDLKKIKKAHGVYVNVSEKDASAIWLSAYLEDKPKLKFEIGKPFDVNIDLVVHSGFML
jgi:hypothetical protein